MANLVHFVLALPILAVAVIVCRLLGYEVGGWGALALPFVIALQLPMLAGLTLALSALNVLFKDVRDLVQNLMTLAFFMAPIIYSLDTISIRPLRWVIRLNPFTPFILGYQDALFRGVVPAASVWLQMLLVAAVSWVAGAWLFDRLRTVLVELA